MTSQHDNRKQASLPQKGVADMPLSDAFKSVLFAAERKMADFNAPSVQRQLVILYRGLHELVGEKRPDGILRLGEMPTAEEAGVYATRMCQLSTAYSGLSGARVILEEAEEDAANYLDGGEHGASEEVAALCSRLEDEADFLRWIFMRQNMGESDMEKLRAEYEAEQEEDETSEAVARMIRGDGE